MFDNARFQQLVDAGQPTGEVIATDRFLVTVNGLGGVSPEALVLFENGDRGIVREIMPDSVLVMNLRGEETELGSLVVLRDNTFTTPVGEGLIGRVINTLCEPLDGKGSVQFSASWPIYNQAPGMTKRSILNEQLPTGVTLADTMFPIVLGQRIAMLGDTKSGKTTYLTQLGVNQLGAGRVVVYVLIGKRRVEVDQLVRTLTDTGAMAHSIVVVANVLDSLTQSYLAPYIGCTIAEYLWYTGHDTIIIYDDLSSHAKVYREVALLAGDNPGRESYPGDMFFAHSTLLERAGKLAENGKTLTALPVVITPGDDITAFLPTSMMSITDGQLIFDLATFRQNIKPAINTGLSVSRVGGRVQTERQKKISGAVFRHLAAYRQASEFSHFGAEVTPETQQVLNLGKAINEAFRQTPSELYSLVEQQLILETILAADGQQGINVGLLKLKAKELAPNVKQDADFDVLIPQLTEMVAVQTAATAEGK